MAQANPFDQFDQTTSAPTQGPVYGAPPKPEPAPKPDSPPSGYRWGPNGTLEPIPGGPADKAEPAASSVTPEQRAQIAAEARQKLQLIDSLDKRSKEGLFATGFGSGIASNFNGTTAADVSKDVQTLSAAGALQRIMEMSASNGGKNPLTPLSNADFVALGQSIANLDPTQSDEQFQRNLKAYRDIYTRALQAVGEQPGVGAQERDEQPPAFAGNAAVPPPDGGQPPAGGPPAPPTLSPTPERQQINESGYRNEDDPSLTGVRGAYLRMLEQNVPPGQVVQQLRALGVTDPEVLRTTAQQAEFRRQNPDVPLDRYDIDKVDDRVVPLSGFEKAASALGGTALGTYAINAGQFLSGNTLDNLAADPERARAAIDVANVQNPNAALAGQISGGILGAMGGEALLARAGMAPGFARGLASDVGMGAANGAGMADDGNRGQNALLGAGLALGGNLAGNALTRGAGAAARGVTDPAVSRMRDVGAITTVGQTYGRSGRVGEMVKGVEDRLAGTPVVGDVVNARRRESYDAFNAGAFDHALKPIGANVGGKVGEEAMQIADEAVSNAYARALNGKFAPADRQFQADLTAALTGAGRLERVGPEVLGGIKDILEPYMQQGSTGLSGEAMQQISRELRALRKAYGNDPMANRIGGIIENVENSVFGVFRRNAPEVLPAYKKATIAARRLYTLERAVLAAKNTDGQFTPAQLGSADREATKQFGGRRAASTGKGQFHEYQRAGQQTLPNKIPDSGTAGRLLVGAAGIGGLVGGGAGLAGGDPGAGTATGTGTGLALATILAAAYSKAGQRMLTKPGRGTSNRVVRAIGGQRSQQLAPRIGAGTGAALLPGTSPGQ